MTQKKLLLIVNPKAGQKKAARLLADMINIFNRAGYAVMVHITEKPGDGCPAVLRYAKEIDLVVCCGGDGTFNETLSGVIQSGKELPIGYIPAGSTNDLASSLSLSGDLLQAARDIVEGNAEGLDVGNFAGRYFSYVASFGLFTKTSYATPQELKNVFGHAAYILSGIQEISQIKTYHLKFSLPGGEEIEDDFIFGAISNSTRFGGVLSLSKELVDLQDGKLELLLIRAPKDFMELADCVRAMQHQTYDSPMITFLSASSFEITTAKCFPWTLDGEKEEGSQNISVHCLHKAIQIIRNL